MCKNRCDLRQLASLSAQIFLEPMKLTKLADTVELEGDWKVGLAEMLISGAVCNVVAN